MSNVWSRCCYCGISILEIIGAISHLHFFNITWNSISLRNSILDAVRVDIRYLPKQKGKCNNIGQTSRSRPNFYATQYSIRMKYDMAVTDHFGPQCFEWTDRGPCHACLKIVLGNSRLELHRIRSFDFLIRQISVSLRNRRNVDSSNPSNPDYVFWPSISKVSWIQLARKHRHTTHNIITCVLV